MTTIPQFFFKLKRAGQFKIKEDGTILLEGVNAIFFPALTVAKICKVSPETLYNIGIYHAKKAIELYTKFFGLVMTSAVAKLLSGMMDKVIKFIIDTMSTIGWGKFEIEKMDLKKKEAIITNKVNPVARCYIRDFGRAEKPIDYYLVGLFEGASEYLKVEIECKETKCIACGDNACVFVIKWTGA